MTELGKRQAVIIGEALSRTVRSVDRLLTTPLVRARGTAKIIANTAGWPEPQVHDLAEKKAAEPEKSWSRHLLESFQEGNYEVVAYVGHDPTLSKFISLLLTGEEEPRKVEMDRSAAAMVSFEGQPQAGTGLLRWLLVPQLLEDGTGENSATSTRASRSSED